MTLHLILGKTKLRPIPNFPGYFADKQGNIWSTKVRGHSTGTSKPRKQKPSLRGKYLCVWVGKKESVHRLILETFVGPCPEGMEARHKNNNKHHNELSNLKWDTHLNNMKDRIKYDTLGKLAKADVIEIKRLLESGEITQTELGKLYNVTSVNICNINKGKSWSHL